MDSKKLYTQIEEKDEQIFFAFWKDHLRLFYKIAQTIMLPKCSESDIEDCLQESMIYMWKHLKDYDPERYSLKNWASMIVASRAKNWITSSIRHDRKMEKIQEHFYKNVSVMESSEESYLAMTAQENLMDLFDTLSYPAEIIMKLRYIYGQKPGQIADFINMSVKQVDNCIYKAKQTLKRRWKREQENH